MELIQAKWPNSKHIAPKILPAGTVLNGNIVPIPFRILAEDEYQLLLAGFRAAGGKEMP